MWIDGFSAGIRTPEEAAQLVADAKRGNINTLIVQVRRRADSYYLQTLEPPVEEAPYDQKFDALAYIIDLAHRENMEVHAWMNAMTVWKNQTPPRSPDHILNKHGINAPAGENWLTASPTGNQLFPVGYFLDPGHPAAMEHLVQVYTNVVRKYKVDGIHFDYIRYPETDEKLSHGSGVGYNPVSLARFQRATGRTDTPAPGDPQWIEWRRQQVTQLVRRVYIESKAINPRIKVSAATIAWGKPPVKEKDFLESAPGQRIFQNWHGWLKEGILDMAVPMNYARESDPVVRAWWDGWILFEKKYKHGRQMIVGVGSYVNTPEQTIAQVQRVRKPAGKDTADGVSFFSYKSLLHGPAKEASPEPVAASSQRLEFLSAAASKEAPFQHAAPIPRAQWIDQPQTGYVAGILRTGNSISDGSTVQIRRAGWNPFRRARRVLTDCNGFYGFTALKPGKYEIRVPGKEKSVAEVVAGQVTRVNLSL